MRAIDLNRMMRDSPILYRHFADPSFASMAIDDVGPLTRLGAQFSRCLPTSRHKASGYPNSP